MDNCIENSSDEVDSDIDKNNIPRKKQQIDNNDNNDNDGNDGVEVSIGAAEDDEATKKSPDLNETIAKESENADSFDGNLNYSSSDESIVGQVCKK